MRVRLTFVSRCGPWVSGGARPQRGPAGIWAKLIKEPEDRQEAVGRLLEAAGGKLLGLWYAFGDHDGYALGEVPDNTAMVSALITVAGSGAFSSVSTTVLVTVEEMLDALGRAQRIAYRPPGD